MEAAQEEVDGEGATMNTARRTLPPSGIDLRKQLARLADEADMTMRAFVLDALRAKGLDVRADDLADLRKDRR